MNAKPQKKMKIVGWIWSHISAAVGLGLILFALIIGYRVGRPSGEDAGVQSVSESHEHAQEDADGKQQMYTCSMHPSVRLPDPDAKCPICFMDLIPVVDSGGGEGTELQLVLSESAKATSQIETTKVGRFFPTAEVRLYGKLVYDETSVARISAYFPGRIDRLFVNYVGVTVQKGDHLAELYSPELLAAFAELEQAKIAFDASTGGSEFLRTTSQQTLDASREKLRLFGVTQEQIDQIESGLFVSDELTIYSPISGVVTHLQTREGDYLKTGDAIATVADLSRLWLDLEAYESQLPMLRWGIPVTFTVEAHPGEVFRGKISFIEPIVDDRTRTAAVRVAVDNSDLRLKPGMFVTAIARPKVTADSAVLSDDLAGKWVSPMHPTHVKDGPGLCEVCGMDMVPAESLGIVGDPSKAQPPMVIPRTALLFTGTRSVVYVQVPDAESPTYEMRTVEIGPRAGELYTIKSGLKVGEDVVTNGAFRIDSSMQILAKPSMMMPTGGASGAGHNHGSMSMGSSGGSESSGMSDMSGMDMKPTAPEPFLESLEPIYAHYFQAQASLAADDLGGFIEHADGMGELIDATETTGLVGDLLNTWRRSSSMIKPSGAITTIEDARAKFEHMSMGILDIEKAFGHQSETWNVAFCPMAFDFKGAKWIQQGEDISNPYFGTQMIGCGDIKQTLAPASSEEGHTND